MHCEDLWEKCENLHNEIGTNSVRSILDELETKISLYKALNIKEIPPEEVNIIKSRTFGEILYTLTSLSVKENVNVFEALGQALQFHSIEHYSEKYKD